MDSDLTLDFIIIIVLIIANGLFSMTELAIVKAKKRKLEEMAEAGNERPKKAFELSEDGFQWLGDYEITADEVLGGIAPKANKLEQAKRLLREVAETNNAMQSNEIFNLAEEQGISRRTLENAKKELSIRAKRINNSWYWELDKIKPE